MAHNKNYLLSTAKKTRIFTMVYINKKQEWKITITAMSLEQCLGFLKGNLFPKNLLPEEDYIGSYAYQQILILLLEITAY